MTENIRETTDDSQPGFSKLEGYLALVCVIVMMLAPVLLRLPSVIALPVWILVWVCAWLFAISGVRRGVGGARVAAGISLAVLTLHAAIFVLIALH